MLAAFVQQRFLGTQQLLLGDLDTQDLPSNDPDGLPSLEELTSSDDLSSWSMAACWVVLPPRLKMERIAIASSCGRIPKGQLE